MGDTDANGNGPRHPDGRCVLHSEDMSHAAPPPSPHDTSTPRWFDPAVLAATCGGLGGIGFAPGTFGAVAGTLVTLFLSRVGLPPLLEVCLVVAVNILGIPICTRAAGLLGRGEDPGAIIFDEVASVPLAALAVPAAARSPQLLAALFVLHRLFDITKPFPCRRLERLPSGLGIMADDWGAAAYAAVFLTLGRWLGLQ